MMRVLTKTGSRQSAASRCLGYVNCLLSTFLKTNQRFQLVIPFIICILASCGSKPNHARLIQEGKILMEANDCKTCHHATNKIIGPPHTDVAKKYEYTDANVALLAQRIIDGSSGVWGDIPMNAHPDLSKENAEKIARYVLSLDGEEPK